MDYSKVEQIFYGPSSETRGELVMGVCDYIPYGCKSSHSLRISIEGDIKHVVNNILWS